MTAQFEVTSVADWLDDDADPNPEIGRVFVVNPRPYNVEDDHSHKTNVWTLKDDDGETYIVGIVCYDNDIDVDDLIMVVFEHYQADLGITELYEDGRIIIG